MSTLKIIDVSRHNGTIAWDKVAKQVDGVIIRAGYRSVGGAGSRRCAPAPGRRPGR